MNWLGFCACIAAWVAFINMGQAEAAVMAFVSAIICSWMGDGPILRATFKSDEKKGKPE